MNNWMAMCDDIKYLLIIEVLEMPSSLYASVKQSVLEYAEIKKKN